jgi:hypothetical protein
MCSGSKYASVDYFWFNLHPSIPSGGFLLKKSRADVAPFLIIQSEVTMFYPRWDSDFTAIKMMGEWKSDTDLIDIYWNKRIIGSWKKEPLKKKRVLDDWNLP